MPLSRSAAFLALCILVFTVCPRTEVEGARRTNAAPPAGSSDTSIPQAPPSSCPVTHPPERPFVPPAPYQGKPGKGVFWFGSEKLWTWLLADGVWQGLHTESGYGNKLFFYSVNFDWNKDRTRRVVITGKRRDAGAPPFVTEGRCCSGGGVPPNYWFIVAGVDIPAPGCWEITADNRGENLSFVVWVAPLRALGGESPRSGFASCTI